jgi:hypothetical protein
VPASQLHERQERDWHLDHQGKALVPLPALQTPSTIENCATINRPVLGQLRNPPIVTQLPSWHTSQKKTTMRINKLRIKNFKAINYLELSEIGDVVVIAGPNGCGKSCIFDAIRLMKSFYGGYRSANEWHSFFSEFHINLNRPIEVSKIFADRSIPLEIEATFFFTESELHYVRDNCEKILYERLWRQHVGQAEEITQIIKNMPAGVHDKYAAIRTAAQDKAQEICRELANPLCSFGIVIDPEHNVRQVPSELASFAFSTFEPSKLGIIDYHGPNRNYARENFGSVNISIQESSDRMAQSALYNSMNKYSNIKSELAAAFVRDILAEKVGGKSASSSSIIAALTELFEIFMPGKKFFGPRPTNEGNLSFPVILDSGGERWIPAPSAEVLRC